MNPTLRTPPAGTAGALLIAFGLGVVLWYGWDWYHLPRWTSAEIEQSVELNLVLDLRRNGASMPDPAQAQAMRARIREELLAEIAREQEGPRGYTLAGLVIALFGFAQMLIRMAVARHRTG